MCLAIASLALAGTGSMVLPGASAHWAEGVQAVPGTEPEIVKAGSMPVAVTAAMLGGLRVSGARHARMPELWGWVLALVALLAGLLGGLTAGPFQAPSSLIVVVSALVGTVTISELSYSVGVTLVD